MKLKDVCFAEKVLNHPSVLVLKALLMGLEVELEGRKVRFAHRKGGGFSPVLIGTSTKDGVTEPCVLGMDDMTLSFFISECEGLSDDELALLGANLALNDFKF